MPSFADSFWSDDLISGLDILFDKLYKGCDQCNSFIQLFASRMQFEVNYGKQLCAIDNGIDSTMKGPDTLNSDDYNTTSMALVNMIKQMEIEGEQHITIASNIESLVLRPFSKWCGEHHERIKYSEKILMDNIKNFQKSNNYVNKLSMNYFKYCKNLEDFKRINFPTEEQLSEAMKHLNHFQKHELLLQKEKDNEIFGKFGSIEFDIKSLKQLLKLLLQDLPKTDYKLPLINYNLQNTNSGHEITKFLLKKMSLTDFDQAEEFGQDLLNYGFLKYCNGVGNNFVNSKKFQYQWKEYAYKFANVPLPNNNSIDLKTNESDETNRQYLMKTANLLGRMTLSENNPVSDKEKDHPTRDDNTGENDKENGTKLSEPPLLTDTEKELFRLIKDTEKADSKYFKECHKMDALRCSVEELMVDHLNFMEKCELDRLKAIKKATMDFCSTISNKISYLKLQIEKMIDIEDSMDATSDLLKLITTYNTGLFQPKVIAYNNYYCPGIFQNFGIQLETRCRLDNTIVPLIVSVILSYMDSIYPDLTDDKTRVSVWTNPVKLSLTHELRSKLNKTQFKQDSEIIQIIKDGNYDPSVIVSVLKIYLLELPEPLIPNELCDVLRVLYEQYPPPIASSEVKSDPDLEIISENNTKRITGLYTALASLSKPHLATLDAIMTHFYRLIKILKMAKKTQLVGSEEQQIGEAEKDSGVSLDKFTDDISEEFANCIIHAKVYDDNQLGYKIFHDLLKHKKKIFSQLKRQASSSGK